MHLSILLEVKLSYEPSCPSVGWSVCHNFLKGREVSMLPSDHLLIYICDPEALFRRANIFHAAQPAEQYFRRTLWQYTYVNRNFFVSAMYVCRFFKYNLVCTWALKKNKVSTNAKFTQADVNKIVLYTYKRHIHIHVSNCIKLLKIQSFTFIIIVHCERIMWNIGWHICLIRPF